MKNNKFQLPLLFCFLIALSCQDKALKLNEIPAKDNKGNTQILVATPAKNKNYVEFDDVNHYFIETEKSYTLSNIAHTGYLAGKNSLQKVIVLGETAQIGSLVSTLPIGVARITSEIQTIDWHIYAEINTEICDFEDFVLNHYPLKNALQKKLEMLEKGNTAYVIWYDEDFLDFKINQLL